MRRKKVYDYEDADGEIQQFEITELPVGKIMDMQNAFEAAGTKPKAQMAAGAEFIKKCCPAFDADETGMPLFNWLLTTCLEHNGLGQKPEEKLDEAKND